MQKTPKWIGLILLLWTGCSQPANTRTDKLEGSPPPPSEDPFFFVAIPANAVAADTNGTMDVAPKPVDIVKPPVVTDIDSVPKVEPKAAEAKEIEPKALPLPDQTPPRYACFSCVEICLVDDDQTQCGDREDTICGWGAHPSREVASKLAQVECDGALDIARESIRFARIEGSCPIATCEAQ